jgi:hypothetical protein
MKAKIYTQQDIKKLMPPRLSALTLAQYDSIKERTKEQLAQKLVCLTYPDAEKIVFNSSGDATVFLSDMQQHLKAYVANICQYVPTASWCLLKREDRYKALTLLALEAQDVPGGTMFTVKEETRGRDKGTKDWVFLNTANEIGHCEPRPLFVGVKVR